METISDKQATKILKDGYGKSETILNDPNKLDKLIKDLLKAIPGFNLVGDTLSKIPTLVSMLQDYRSGRYKAIPVASLISVISALTYFLSPIDVIPDFIPFMGLIDDTAVLAICLRLIQVDLDKYIEWKEKQQN